MKLILTIFFSIFLCMAYAQTKKYYNVLSNNNDTNFWYKYCQKQLNKLSLNAIDTITEKECIRIWTNAQILEIYRYTDNNYSARLINWTDEYVDASEKSTHRTYIETTNLSVDTAKNLYIFYQSSAIKSLPTDDSIINWKRGCDGIIYTIESSTKRNYFFKTYWSPKTQDSLKESIIFQSFIDSIFKLINSTAIKKEFMKRIPFQCFINGGATIICKKIETKKEDKNYRKERDIYRRKNHLD